MENYLFPVLFSPFYLIIELPDPPKFCELRNDTVFEVVCTAGEYQPHFECTYLCSRRFSLHRTMVYYQTNDILCHFVIHAALCVFLLLYLLLYNL